MEMTSRLALLGVSAFLACGPPSVEERPRASGEVPEELALVLLGIQEPEDRIFVGSPPAEVLAVVPILPGGSVVGGVTREGGGTLVLEVDDGIEAALSAYAAAMEDAGWEYETGPGFRGGFVASRRSTSGVWCGSTHSLRTSALTRNDVDYLSIRFYRLEPGPTPCENARLRGQRGPGHALTVPTLQPPTGAEVSIRGGGGSSHRIDMEVLVRTSLGASELFEHYARQLGRSGWTSTAESSDRQVSIGLWSTQDDLGNPAVGVFATWAFPGDDEYWAWIRLERAEQAR